MTNSLTKSQLLALIAAILGHTNLGKILSIFNFTKADMNSPIMPRPTRPVNPAGAATPPTSAHPAAVPISLYREVVTELQAAKAAMEALKAQNQQLTNQNQQLRQEIEKTVQSALTLREMAGNLPSIEATAPSKAIPTIDLAPEFEPDFQIPLMPAAPRPVVRPAKTEKTNLKAALKSSLKPNGAAVPANKLVMEEDSKPRRKLQPESEASGELSGWWLGLVIVMIVVTAFGAGFLIVRPLLTPNSK